MGPEFRAVASSKYNTFESTELAAEWLKEHPIKNARILVKGSRGIALEKLIPYL